MEWFAQWVILFLLFQFIWLLFISGIFLLICLLLLKVLAKDRYNFLFSNIRLIIIYTLLVVWFWYISFSMPQDKQWCNNIIRKIINFEFSKENCLGHIMDSQQIIKEQQDSIYYQKIVSERKVNECATTFSPDKCYLELWECARITTNSEVNECWLKKWACEKISDQYLISQCWYDKAQLNNDEKLCGKVSFWMDIFCLTELAIKNSDENLCHKIQGNIKTELNATQKQICLYEVSLKKIPKNWVSKDCDIFNKNTEVWQSFRIKCYNYIWECEKLWKTSIVNKCFAEHGKCEKIENDAALKDMCYWNLKQCDKVMEPFYKESCLNWDDMSNF